MNILRRSRVATRGVLALFIVLVVMSALLVDSSATSSSPTTTSTTTSTVVGTSSTTTISTSTTSTILGTTTTRPTTTTFPWPSGDSAAVAVPQLSVVAASPNQPRVPIASLTKLMTAWVVLQQFPIAYDQKGPCTVVNAADVAFFHENLSIQESTAKIRLGEVLCEGTLLRGLFVHSAGDYAMLLVQLTRMSQSKFINTMNVDALSLGLSQTHYADFTGISPQDLSTAQDVVRITVDLMTSEPVIDSIAALTKVRLPVAGELGSYTPFIGTDGVVGVKSGYTLASGGCVAMAINVMLGGIIVPTYEVVLSQQGPNGLNVAGAHGIALMKALRSSMSVVSSQGVRTVTWTGSSSDVVPTTTTTTTPTTTTTTTTPSI